jgi:hypothetical protein
MRFGSDGFLLVSGEYCCTEGTLVEGVVSTVSEECTLFRLFVRFGINNISNYCIKIASVSVLFIIHNIIIKLSGCEVHAFDTAL